MQSPYDRSKYRFQIEKKELKIIYNKLRQRGYTLDSITKKIGSSFRSSLYYGCSLNENCFRNLKELYIEEIPYQIKEPFIKLINLDLNEYLAELVGIILGDGHLSKSGNTLTITLNFIDEDRYVEYVMDLITKVFNIKPSIVRLPNNKANQIRVYGKGIINALENIGLKKGNKVKNKVGVPLWIKNNLNYSVSCLRGLFDTDGSIYLSYDKRRISMNFKNNSELLVKDFKKMCEVLDIQINKIYEGITKSRGKQFDHYKIEINKQDQIRKFLTTVKPNKWIYKNRLLIYNLEINGSNWCCFFKDLVLDE